MRVLSYIGLAVLLISSSAKAQKVLRLDDAIAGALHKNFDILLAKNDSASFALDEQYSFGLFIPRVNFTAGKVWNTNAQKQELASGVKRDTTGIRSNNMTASLSANWTLFDGLRMFATREKLTRFRELGELQVKEQMVNTIADVINNYFGIVRQKQQLKAIEEQMSINEERVALAEKKISTGLGSGPEMLQAKVDLNAQKASRLQQITLIAQLRDQLNQLIGIPNGEVYDVEDSIPVNTSLVLGELNQSVESTNPSLLIARKNISIAELTLKERKADLLPVLSFNSAYNFSRTENKAVINNFTPLFNQNKGLNYGFGLNVPILNGFNTRRLMKQSQLDIQYQQLFYENQYSRVNLAITNAFKDYELQKQLLALEEENIRLAKENVAIALERFKLGVSTWLELREAQISLELAYNRLIAARYNTKVAETELMRQKGELVK